MKSLLGTLTALLRVTAAVLVVYAITVIAAALIPFGGQPMIHRLVPLQKPGGPSHSLVRFREAETKGPVDIVFVGSSHTYRGFDPRIFSALGYSSQNLGSSSQTPVNSVAVLQRHLAKLRPKLVIYEIYQTALTIDGMESFYDLLSNTALDGPMLQMTWDVRQPEAWTALLATGVRNFRTPLSSYQQKGKDGRDDLYIEGGYVQTTATMPADRLMRLRSEKPPLKLEIDPRQLRFLGKCAELVRSHGAEFVVCSYPVPAETRRDLGDFEERQKQIGEFLKPLKVPYHDFNESMTLDTSLHYFDEVHLNQAGVELFNAEVIQWLRPQGLLPTPSQVQSH